MTAHSTAVHSAEAASHPRSRLRARLMLAGLSTCGLAALAWASFLPDYMRPLPRLIYNPSDSVPVGWYRVDPSSNRTDSLPRPLSVDSIVLVPLPDRAAMLAAQAQRLPQLGVFPLQRRLALQTCFQLQLVGAQSLVFMRQRGLGGQKRV